jgi:hypothetical protein
MNPQAPSSWAIGWTAFAALMMMMMGIWWLTAGIVGISTPGFYAVTEEYVFQFDPRTWGWIHVLSGIVVLVAGFAVFAGAVWARTVGVILALWTGLIAFAWLPWNPIWAIVLILISITVIWALTVHGRDITE